MANVYTDTPYNFEEIVPFVTADTDTIVTEVYRKKGCYFYDTCSFRSHANLPDKVAEYLFQYIRSQDGIVIITRCILMELASHNGILNPEYLSYMKRIKAYGIDVFVVYEEDLFEVMNVCFGTNAAINAYLMWAVRMMQGPVSSVTETVMQNKVLYHSLIEGKNLESRGIYKEFFVSARGGKESGDNLGEEVLAICLHMLSHIPGEADGKFCVITDDKGAGSRIDVLFQKTSRQHEGNKIRIFSTPKLVQFMYAEGILKKREDMKIMLETGRDGNIVILGTRNYDLRTNEISVSSQELVDLITTPNAIHIIF